MRFCSASLILSAALFICVFAGAPAHAQATRTWVSGVGDDVNPCSRTAPCKTFAGAISKTAAGGEINCIDPGGFGAVTITKAIAIICDGVEAGVLASGTNGVTVNAGAADVVYLSGLDIEGTGTGFNGVLFLAGGALHVENSVIRGFQTAAPNGNGILFSPSSAARLYVSNVTVASNGVGVEVRPAAGGSAFAMIEGVHAVQNTTGIRGNGTTGPGAIAISVKDSEAAGNSGAGFNATAGAGGQATDLMLDDVVSSGNGTGMRVDAATARLGSSVVSGNGVGLSAVNGGSLLSYGDNQVNGNSSDGSAPVIPLK